MRVGGEILHPGHAALRAKASRHLSLLFRDTPAPQRVILIAPRAALAPTLPQLSEALLVLDALLFFGVAILTLSSVPSFVTLAHVGKHSLQRQFWAWGWLPYTIS